ALTVNGGNSTTPAESVTAYYHGIDAVSTSTFGVFSSSTNGIGLHADGPLGAIEAQSPHGVAVHAQVDGGGEGNGVQRIFTGTTGPSQTNVFSVDISGNLYAAGALLAAYPTAGTFQNAPATLTSNGQATVTDPNSTSALGIAVIGAGGFGTVYIATSGFAPCLFDGAVTTGDYVGISRNVIGRCTDLGSTFPSNVQVLGRVLQTGAASTSPYPVYLFGGEQHGGSSVMTVNTGPGLVGGPITSIGTVSIANAGVTNSMLLNNSLAVNPGAGLSGGGTVPLGGSITLNNTGALSFNGRSGNILPAAGDYSFSQLNGTAALTQLPASVVYKNQSNTFTADQTINGTLNGTTANLQNVAVNTTSSQFLLAPLQVNDNGGAPSALYAYSQNHKAAAFQSTGPVILTANNFVEDVFTIFKTGEVSVLGGVTARAFTGDGSALFNVNASSIGGISSTNVATTSALTSETSARQSADTTLQSNIDNEGSARQSADAALATSISAETAARQSDVSNLQTTINSLSAGDAKLAASNTFTAGTQDFSGAGATLPVRALLSSQTPASCIAGKELLIKTDAPAGQQLFICDAGGATWNLVGDGASGGVTSFNGRNGSVSSGSGDYSFSQISGSVAASQLPANVVYSSQANTFSASQTVNGNMTASAFIGNGGGLSNVNAAMLNNLTSASFAQLGASSNTFTGSVTAASFSGNGSAVTNVNAATVNNLQMLKLAAAITPAAVGLQSCSEQSFNVPGINNGDVLLSVQLATHSPGTNIAIGGWRVSGANTVAIQFCNVSRSSSTPAAGTYTFALLR
ncbi:MAG TPA: hypothetical protein VKE93_02590, partial [Candidatus Angelobacter sp.]|nr:hypothetical protein [Candidatus Angelobacter sp.]